MLPLAPPVVPTTPLETAEERLAQDLERLARDLERWGRDPGALRDGECHVAIDERRVSTYRALPHHRQGTGPHDARRLLAEAYEHVALAYRRCGELERSANAALRAHLERRPIAAS